MGQMLMHRVRVMQPSRPGKPLRGVVAICNRAGCCYIMGAIANKKTMDAGFGVLAIEKSKKT